MGKVNDSLMYLLDTKKCIKNAIEEHNISIENNVPFRKYAELISQIPTSRDIALMLQNLLGVNEQDSINILIDDLEVVKTAIKNAITEKGVPIPSDTTFREYANKIEQIDTSHIDKYDFWDQEMLECYDLLPANSDNKSRLIFLAYQNDPISFKIGGTNNYKVELSDGTVYSSNNQQTEEIVTHTWVDSSVPISTNGSKLYYGIIYSDTKIITQDIPKCRFVVIDNCSIQFEFLKLLEMECVLVSIQAEDKFLVNNSVDFQYACDIYPKYIEGISFNSDDNFDDLNFGAFLKYIRVKSGSRINYSKLSYSFATLEKAEISDTSNVTNMRSMFEYCSLLKEVPLFNTSNVKDMTYMFYNCYSLKEVPLFNTSNVTDMGFMFYNCSLLKEVPLFNTSNVTDMRSMFYNCYSLNEVPLFNTSNVTYMRSMFYNCYSLKTIKSLDLNNVKDSGNAFSGCVNLTNITLKNIGCDLDLSASTNYSQETLVGILNNLKTIDGKTLTLGSTNLAKLTTEQKAIATNKGWTLA